MKPSLYGTRLFFTTDGDSSGGQSNGVTVSSTNTYYSAVFSAPYCLGFSISMEWTGTPTGTFTLWFSNKDNPILTTDADWNQDTTFAPTNPAGAAGSMGDGGVGNAQAGKWRVKYVNASGTGVLTGQAHFNRA